MNSKERFLATLSGKPADRPPLFEDGVREAVLRVWRRQGLGKSARLEDLFTSDFREEIEPDLEPSPTPSYWPKTQAGLRALSRHYDPYDPARLPEGWNELITRNEPRDHPLILRVHRGYFLTLGVHGWNRFTDAIQFLVDKPVLVKNWLNIQADFMLKLIDRILTKIRVDAALFSEPIGGNHGPLISPKMYSEIVLDSYRPILEVLQAKGVTTVIYRTYANTRELLPEVVKAGFNCLWACECNAEAMNYLDIRKEFGMDLRLIGGIDADSLRQDQPAIYQSIMDIVPALVEDGGYLPLADGRVREDVKLDNYLYYRRLLESICLRTK